MAVVDTPTLTVDVLALVLSAATLGVTILGIIIAVVAVIGANTIKRSAQRSGEESAKQAIANMVDNEDIKSIIKRTVETVAKQEGHAVYDDLRVIHDDNQAINIRSINKNEEAAND